MTVLPSGSAHPGAKVAGLALLASAALVGARSLRGRTGHSIWIAVGEDGLLPDDEGQHSLRQPRSDNIGQHSLAQTGSATLRTDGELLQEELEDHEDYRSHEEEEDLDASGNDRERTTETDLEDIATLQRVGRRIDANNDTLLSADELHQFAQAVRSRQWWDQTSIVHEAIDKDGDGVVSLEDLRASEIEVYRAHPERQAQRFSAADGDGDGLLDRSEMHAFLHPELGGKVLEVEVAFQLARLDKNGDGALDFGEFKRIAGEQSERAKEDLEDELEDFKLHDVDADGQLSANELLDLLKGHGQLTHQIGKVLNSVDRDGDGHIHVDSEVPHSLEHLLDSEFVEDFFFHEHAESIQHHEL